MDYKKLWEKLERKIKDRQIYANLTTFKDILAMMNEMEVEEMRKQNV